MDHGWASTIHTFQGRTVDNIIAAMESSHPHLTTQKSFYVEISRARHGALSWSRAMRRRCAKPWRPAPANASRRSKGSVLRSKMCSAKTRRAAGRTVGAARRRDRKRRARVWKRRTAIAMPGRRRPRSRSGAISAAGCDRRSGAESVRKSATRPAAVRGKPGKLHPEVRKIYAAGYANGATPSAAAASFNPRSRLASGQPSRIARAR